VVDRRRARITQVSARRWLASFVDCPSTELQLWRGPVTTERGVEAEYARGGTVVGTILLTVRRSPSRAAVEHRWLIVETNGRIARRLIAPDGEIEW
jgi:hypothetical protein